MRYTHLGNTGISIPRQRLETLTYGSKRRRDGVLAYDAALAAIETAIAGRP